jgi:hypothetical protein
MADIGHVGRFLGLMRPLRREAGVTHPVSAAGGSIKPYSVPATETASQPKTCRAHQPTACAQQ